MRLALFGYTGKVGRVLAPALEAAGHEVQGVGRDGAPELGSVQAAIDFTRPDAAAGNVGPCLERGVPCIVGTSGLAEGELCELDGLARRRGVPCLVVPNFALGAVLMLRFAAEASRHLPRAEIVELHGEGKLDAPSGTAEATAALLRGDPVIHSVRLPGLVAHQEVLFGGAGQLLTIRHDAFSREAYVPGVLIALDRLPALPPGLTVGLESLID